MDIRLLFFIFGIIAAFPLLTPAEEFPAIAVIAGTGKSGYAGDGGKAGEALLNNPFGVIVAPDGDIVFCDTINHVIRRIARKSGIIDTLVGTGEKGYDGNGGEAKKARLNEPYEVRFHPGGDLYWVEMQNHLVRRLNARTNLVELVAGTGVAGFSGDGGPATAATMDRPHSIVFDASGENLYLCDIGNHRIRRVELGTGIISTWCGTGTAGATPDGAEISAETPLNGPRALALAPDGDFWLALREGNQVFRLDIKESRLHLVAGTGKKGFHPEARPAKEALLSGPKGVALSPDGKLVYLADTESHTVRAIDLETTPPLLRVIAGDGEKGDGPGEPDPLKCRMNRLHGVGVDPLSGDLLIGDSEAHRVRKVSGLPGTPLVPLGKYASEEIELLGRKGRLTRPAEAAQGNPWMWRTRFYGAFPSVDEALLAEGWHIAYFDFTDQFGSPGAIREMEAFYQWAVKERMLHARPILEGFSRGGLSAMNWSIAHPDKVTGIYLDAPVLDIRSWPKPGGGALWQECLVAYGLTEETAAAWQGPLTGLKALVAAGLPVFVVAGGADDVVPYAENAGILETRYRELGGEIDLIVKAGAGHHPHSLHDPAPVVAWVKRVMTE
jgi:sugar lactone lactonase YvrE/pimeloyl-ACP methyl ester carboxylesterase